MEQLDKANDQTTKESDKSETTVRLIELILNMSEADQQNMLKKMQNKHTVEKKAHPEEMRIHPRKTSFIAADCATNNVCFMNFIQDISNGGVFIETNAPFYIGQELKMNFSLPKVETPISIGGEVVRVDSRGIGVKFISEDVHKFDIN
jgi:type IV pilus assembly protein PilZ